MVNQSLLCENEYEDGPVAGMGMVVAAIALVVVFVVRVMTGVGVLVAAAVVVGILRGAEVAVVSRPWVVAATGDRCLDADADADTDADGDTDADTDADDTDAAVMGGSVTVVALPPDRSAVVVCRVVTVLDDSVRCAGSSAVVLRTWCAAGVPVTNVDAPVDGPVSPSPMPFGPQAVMPNAVVNAVRVTKKFFQPSARFEHRRSDGP